MQPFGRALRILRAPRFLLWARFLVRSFRALGRFGLARFGQLHHQALVFRRDVRAAEGLDEARSRPLADLKIALVGSKPDRADLGPSHVAIAADQGEQPARIGIVAASGIEPKPASAFESGPRAAIRAAIVPAAGSDDVLRG